MQTYRLATAVRYLSTVAAFFSGNIQALHAGKFKVYDAMWHSNKTCESYEKAKSSRGLPFLRSLPGGDHASTTQMPRY